MIFKENIDSQQLIALINQDNDVEKYVCSLWTCENPICACNTITINFSPFPFPDNEVSSNQNIPTHTIEFDLVTRTLNNEKISEEDLEFAEVVLAQLEEDDFRILQKRHFLYKNQSTECADVNTIEACFDYQEIERNGLMPAYNDVLPYGNQLQVTIDHKDYLALDQYCLLPKCPCSDTTLTLIPVDGLHKGDKNEFCSIDVNYRKKQWKNFERLSSGLSEQSIRSVIEEQVEDLYKTLHQRHLKLKAIYKNCRKQHLTSNQPTKIVKIGRNDPCPCGSGKKFKKCCLRKSS